MPVYEEIKKTKDGQKVYYIRTYIDGPSGKRIQINRHNKKWIGRDGKLLAQQEEIRLQNSNIQEELRKKHVKYLTINDLVDKYFEFKKGKIDNDSIIKFKNDLNNHFLPTEGKYLITTYSDIQYKEWQNSMCNKTFVKGKDENNNLKYKKYSLTFLNELHRSINALFRFAMINGWITFNPIDKVGRFGTRKERAIAKKEKKWNVISSEQYKELMECTKYNIKYNTMFDLFYSTGLRIGEIMALRWKDYDYDKCRIKVEHTISRKENGPRRLKEPKSVSSKDYIAIDNSLNEKILKYKNKQNAVGDELFIFGSIKYGNEKPISEHAITYAIEKYIIRTNISKNFKPHDFRHSFATLLFSLKVPLPVITKKMRHASIEETLKTYAHIIPEDYFDSNNLINNFKANVNH